MGGLHLLDVFLRLRQHIQRRHSKQGIKLCKSGHFAVYLDGGDEEQRRKRFVVPISYLKHPLFKDLLNKAAEEFGFDHGMGGLTVPCDEKHFMDLTSQISIESHQFKPS